MSSKPWLFQKGQSGNPKGRPPKGYSIVDVIRYMMASSPETKVKLSEKLIELAVGGDMTAIKEVINRMDGMPLQNVKLTNDASSLTDEELNEWYERNNIDKSTGLSKRVSQTPKVKED